MTSFNSDTRSTSSSSLKDSDDAHNSCFYRHLVCIFGIYISQWILWMSNHHPSIDIQYPFICALSIRRANLIKIMNKTTFGLVLKVLKSFEILSRASEEQVNDTNTGSFGWQY